MDRAAHRNFVGRKLGVMKKANTLHHKHNARVIVLVEKNNTIFRYQSDPSWPVLDSICVEPCNIFTPDHFDTVADRCVPASASASAGTGANASRSSSPYSFRSLSSGCELQAVYEAPQNFIHGSIETVCTQDQIGAYDAHSPDALAEKEHSPDFLPVLDIELQSSVTQQAHTDLSLWTSSSMASEGSLDSPSLLDSSSGSLALAPKRAHHTVSDHRRSNVKSPSGQDRTPIRKSNRTHQQAKKYF
ncbi:hypothetical protein GQX73_g1916 [Xylaria multiplex]|uniref:MADS-box domain-containing protein n=1 Tax=Xylaria multiplex TaxID=323545 RepID=A0A7C8IVW6_9PEZI|nr:hypothetical protein GQX73_g1916 [Xylaria multiplex]